MSSNPPPDNSEEYEYLVEATLQLLGSKHKEYMQCMSCGAPIRQSPVMVCADCLGNQCDIYEKVADLPEKSKK